ncbi:hypothetical protein COOONC_04631 [Cooperia oncophora]
MQTSQQQPLHQLPPHQQQQQQPSVQQSSSVVQHSMQPQVMQQLQHHMPQQMPPGLQQSHMASSQQMQSQQSMQQMPQQSLLQQQMGQPLVQQQPRSNNNQGMVTSQQFAQGGGSSQHQTGMGGPMQMSYQGQPHTGPQPSQQPRNPMGQFASRDGTMNVEYQQGTRGGRQQLQMGSQGSVVRNGMRRHQMSGSNHIWTIAACS